MQQGVLIAHVVVGLLFVLCVLIQDKGTGLSATFGGSGGFYASQRGAAKVIHYISVLLCIAFFVLALLYVVLPKPPAGTETPLASPVTSEPLTVESVETTPQ